MDCRALHLIECTYKTNRFNMPLLDIVGGAPINASFTVASAFLAGEAAEHYTWAPSRASSRSLRKKCPRFVITDCDEALMNAIDTTRIGETMRHTLCRWHM